MYIYVLGDPQWPSDAVAFEQLSCRICTVLLTKSLFLLHKPTDISSIDCKKCDKYVTNPGTVSFLQQGCINTTPLLFCIMIHPSKQQHIIYAKKVFLISAHSLHKICIFLSFKINSLVTICTQSAKKCCNLCCGMPLIVHRKRQETKRKQRRFFKMFQRP